MLVLRFYWCGLERYYALTSGCASSLSVWLVAVYFFLVLGYCLVCYFRNGGLYVLDFTCWIGWMLVLCLAVCVIAVWLLCLFVCLTLVCGWVMVGWVMVGWLVRVGFEFVLAGCDCVVVV